ncbi:P-loop containing nucleoside triphosphate hydrolase protein [Phlyctochytrium arcticum]|nr:P-loop containing nucleoside triphosphate hydrolase protein [Phlyctochytrium arcticum]KAI9104616.1 P-loop containing nucleoside triphosphate hydrolase protein [Phlyctochytrium arcticum]
MALAAALQLEDPELVDAATRLGYQGARTVRELLTLDKQALSTKSRVSETTIDHLIDLAIQSSLCENISGDELLTDEEDHGRTLSSGCPDLDELLEGGFQTGEMVEVAGPSSTGKTQLMFFSAITCTASNPSASVLYIDSGNAFSAARISQLFLASDRFESFRLTGMDVEHVLGRITHVPCYDAYALIDILEQLDVNLRLKAESFYQGLQMMVIDSIGSVLGPIVGYGQPHGYAIMTTIGQMIKHIATKYHIAVMVVNSAVSTDFGAGPVDPSLVRTKPALGTFWGTVPSIRLYLSPYIDTSSALNKRSGSGTSSSSDSATQSTSSSSEDEVFTYENRHGVVIPLRAMNCRVTSSHRTVPDRECKIYLGGSEVISGP